ncbi:MAG: polyisoprenoid-binding protein [Betaproteobacteria bacterium]|nr:polyisoprenoid-binding protein [Betaproteobacteria bacterium]
MSGLKAASGALALLCAGAAGAAPAVYEIENAHTFPKFEVSHNGFSNHTGIFTKTSGKITYDREAKSGSMEVTVDTAEISTGIAPMEKFLKSKEFFNIEQYPTMSYKGMRFRFEGDKLVAIEGELTLLGVTRPLTLNVVNFVCGPHPRTKKEECGANAVGELKRSDYGMKAFLPLIGDDIKLSIQTEAYKL